MALKVFISYSSTDIPIVEQIKKAIESPNINVFIAEHSIKPGENLNDSIIKNIKESTMFVLLWSKNATESDYVKQEIGTAKGFGKLIIPFVINEGLVLPEFIRDLKYIRAYENIDKSIKTLQEIVSGKAKEKQELEKKENIKDVVGIAIIAAIILFLASQE